RPAGLDAEEYPVELPGGFGVLLEVQRGVAQDLVGRRGAVLVAGQQAGTGDQGGSGALVPGGDPAVAAERSAVISQPAVGGVSIVQGRRVRVLGRQAVLQGDDGD